ncbi:Hypothetical_protein [Hexamita inflata]|uniref:Hypothetical_protein n=1 Tax=Hexamita inflata TaxID=28002 RepID=A0AA86QU51_9EUKA|nr:Hypothetical protein HINF_LOCUS49181 [Hexamita inflata]
MMYIPPMLKQINISRSPSASNVSHTQKDTLSHPMDASYLTEYQDDDYSFQVNKNISTDFLVVSRENTLILRLKAENEEMRALLEQGEKLEMFQACHDENMQRITNNAGLIKKYITSLKDWIQRQ